MDPAEKKKIVFRTDRVMVPFDEGNTPGLEPLFANHFELMRLNTDVYLDIGIIDPIEMIDFVQKSRDGDVPTGELKFYVLQRIAMTPETLTRLHQKIDELLESQQEEMLGGPSSQKKIE